LKIQAVVFYQPNAYSMVSVSITPAQWAGYLSALAADGKYFPGTAAILGR
jgi:hypothetical protein